MKATDIVNSLIEADEVDPESFIKDFALKDQMITFRFIQSGEFNVYADPPHEYDWLAYSNDKEPGSLGQRTSTFEGYLRPVRDEWVDHLAPAEEPKQWLACPKHKSGHVNQDAFIGPFPSKEAAAHALYKINRGADRV